MEGGSVRFTIGTCNLINHLMLTDDFSSLSWGSKWSHHGLPALTPLSFFSVLFWDDIDTKGLFKHFFLPRVCAAAKSQAIRGSYMGFFLPLLHWWDTGGFPSPPYHPRHGCMKAGVALSPWGLSNNFDCCTSGDIFQQNIRQMIHYGRNATNARKTGIKREVKVDMFLVHEHDKI